ncbi:hypothetical protein [Staphylococcus schweitzeri]|uniref:hypothetical protein n=1 Tax=Staphylococcus schweitzeri TaxID=1654388 RepID=UPI000502329C|nr:hypothetical protein [Staphylococcus schweitzeri]CDR51554.1 hypothetical protein ERS140159_01510 [Staphylococcus schweitzeri]
MTFKNLFLSVVAIILTVCLLGLIVLATNQEALAKVHKTINTLHKIKVSDEDNNKKTIGIFNSHTANASELKNDTNKHNDLYANHTNMFNEQECQVIAERYSNKHMNDNYQLEKVSKTHQGFNYIYSNGNPNGKQHVNISNQGVLLLK